MEKIPPVQAKQSQAETAEGPSSKAPASNALKPPAFQLEASNPAQLAAAGPVVQRSAWSEKLAKIYNEQGRDAYFAELRKINVCDMDVYKWIDQNLTGDDHWLAMIMADYGDEKDWPLHLKVEREMRPFTGCTGLEGVKTILRTEAGAQAKNAHLTKSIHKITTTQTLDRWLLLKLQELGSEANFDWKDKIMEWFLRHNELTAINEINGRGISIVTFDKAFDKWQMKKDKSIEIKDLSGSLRGNTDGNTIRINSALSVEQAVTTMYHEVQHKVVGEQNLPYLDEEVEVRVKTEEMMIKQGLPETKPGYRKADGTVDRDFINNEIQNSSHYNPKDKTRLDRWYEGEKQTGSWQLP